MRALMLLLCAGLPLLSVTAASAASQLPATWIPHEVAVSYENLPRAYSCDALWYKVGDILRAVGAWKAVSITPHDCTPGTRTNGRSPQLEIHFLTLRSLGTADARWAQAQAVEESVELRPGHPKSLTSADCELLRQTEQDVLPLVPSIHVAHSALTCGSGASPFSLTVQTLVPAASAPTAAR